MIAAEGQDTRSPVRSRGFWITRGLILQTVGAGGVAAYLWFKVRHQNIGGHLTAATIRLVWHSEVHTRQGLAVLAAGALIYAAGSVLMARPYVTRPVTLFVAVPLAAVVGLLLLGVLVIVLGVLVFFGDLIGDMASSSRGGSSRRKSAFLK